MASSSNKPPETCTGEASEENQTTALQQQEVVEARSSNASNELDPTVLEELAHPPQAPCNQETETAEVLADNSSRGSENGNEGDPLPGDQQGRHDRTSESDLPGTSTETSSANNQNVNEGRGPVPIIGTAISAPDINLTAIPSRVPSLEQISNRCAKTHHQVRVIHCLKTDQWQCIPERRPLDQCPICEETQLSPFELVPDSTGRQVNDVQMPPPTRASSRHSSGGTHASSSKIPDPVKTWDCNPHYGLASESDRRTESGTGTDDTFSETTCHYNDMVRRKTVTKAFGKCFASPRGIASDPWNDDIIYVADTGNDRVVVIDPKTGFAKLQFGSHGVGKGQFNHPHGVAVSDRDEIIVADQWNHRIQIFDLRGHHLRAFGGNQENTLINPVGVTYVNGQIFVCDAAHIHAFRYNGKLLRKYVTSVHTPWAIAKGLNDSFEILDAPHHKVCKYDSKGTQKSCFLTGQQHPCPITGGLAVDSSGNVLVTNPYEQRIDVFTSGNQYCSSIVDSRRPLGPVADVAVLNDGRVVAACGNEVVMFDNERRIDEERRFPEN